VNTEQSPTQTRTATVLLSGGIDSAACAYLLLSQGFAVQGIFVDYGQAALAHEQCAVRCLSDALGISTKTLMSRGLESYGAGELMGRNAFLLLSAIFLGKAERGVLAIGTHSGTPYYDCSPQFIERMRILITELSDGSLRLLAPFSEWSKRDVYNYFCTTGLDVSSTYSCETGAKPPCGNCSSCKDRRALVC
jgi:7-cyano-7-deazaguanine synthase